MTSEEAIARIENHMAVHRIGQSPHIQLKEALDMAISALRAQAAPLLNAPLALEDLRKMDGEPVWIEPSPLIYKGHWEICNCIKFNLSAYGITWLAYRRKPEGSQA